MKKMIKNFGIFALIAIIGFAIIACKDDDDSTSKRCTSHDWGELTQTTAPGCTTPGEKTQTCENSGCNAVNQETKEVVNPLHVWGEYEQTTPPTCTAKGIKTQTCTLCPVVNPVTSEGDAINAANHDWILSRVTISEGVNAKICNNNGCNEKSDFEFTYSIGNTILNRGIIFYVADGQSGRPLGFTVQGYGNPGDAGYFETYTAYYLEAAPANMTTTLMWSSNRTLIPGLSQTLEDETDWVIGRGRLNTAIIIARGINQSYTTPAASACAALETGDKDDWFLPSKNELNALAQIRGQHGIPNIGWFWSSSQYDTFNAWYQSFSNGNQNNFLKSTEGNASNVRAVRAF